LLMKLECRFDKSTLTLAQQLGDHEICIWLVERTLQ
jgi:hypothetical protein